VSPQDWENIRTGRNADPLWDGARWLATCTCCLFTVLNLPAPGDWIRP